SLLVVAALGYMTFAFYKSKLAIINTSSVLFFNKLIPFAFLILAYFTLFNEIQFFWDLKIMAGGNTAVTNVQKLLKPIVLLMYTFIFFAICLRISSAYIKKQIVYEILIGLSFLSITVFLFQGLNLLGELRENYLSKWNSTPSMWLLNIRYVLFATLAVLWVSISNTLKAFSPSANFKAAISVVFNVTLLAVISNEFIHWMDVAGYQNQYKLGLSLICGAYALALLFIGILQKKKHLRMFAMVIFAVTIVKLFFYDLSSLSTISKTIVLVLLGVLLLFASFLYNKYKDLLFGKEES
ncbi:MAG TPA: DUF2339 domain-containing protein, partial [Segetibacter sp.]